MAADTSPEGTGVMAVNSINTNANALIALQNLNASAQQLADTQNRISTGRKVDTAKDNGATWAVAQNQRSSISALDAVKQSLQRGQSTVDVAMTAGAQISDILNQMRAKALTASDTSTDTSGRASMNADFVALRDQIAKIVTSADFNGVNMLNGASAQSVYALANVDGTSKITVAAQNLSLSAGSILATAGLTATSTINTVTSAGTMLSSLSGPNGVIAKVNSAVAQLGTGANALAAQLTFVGKLQDTLTTGVSNLVDADVAKESATLQALQTKQQLGVQALSIANSSTSILLSLFR
jgi:flagellin